MELKSIGIIGAGKLGMVLAQLALKAGYTVYISGSGDTSRITLIVDTIAPGAIAATNEELTSKADVIILALPLGKFRQIPSKSLADKLVIDATNYWWEVDGPRDGILPKEQSSSEAVQAYFSDARVVKAFSHMGYHHLYDEARAVGAPERKAIAVAGDHEDDVTIVSKIVDDFGFDPVFIGPLAEGRRLEPGSPAFGANEDAKQLRKLTEK
jgi:predicted dinucleotide-binding enzyme